MTTRTNSNRAQAVDARQPLWHAMDAYDVLQRLASDESGLDSARIPQRQRRYGPNALPRVRPVPAWRRFLSHFNDPLILLLLAASVAAFMLQNFVDAGVILAVVLTNAIVGYIQEGKAEREMAALRSMLAPTARVLRDGKRNVVPVDELVPGDVLLLEAGDRVPADARLLLAQGVRADESVLTGESVPADKLVDAVAADAATGDRSSMLYSGTQITSGRARAVVVAIGTGTEIGRIGSLLADVGPMTTPLLQQVARFGSLFAAVAVSVAVVLCFYAVLVQGYGWLDALMVVVALTVGVVPESLPAVITITLAIGVRRMAARNAIVRRLPAVETLGATTVICSDKTGTLTRNEMVARSVLTTAGSVRAHGAGYEPAGELSVDAGGTQARTAADPVIRIGLLCNDARLVHDDGHWRVDGDPMEGALLALAARAGLDHGALCQAYPLANVVPFDASRRFMATLHRQEDGSALLCVKGAPERVMALCAAQVAVDGRQEPLDAPFWQDAVDQAGHQGQRVLAFAWRRLDTVPDSLAPSDVRDLVFAGLVGFIDPPRDEAIRAVAQCRSAGIAVKMITGDHAATAAAIARQLNLADTIRVITGPELEQLSDDDLQGLVMETSVFARATPEHKLRIVRALQSLGHTVAMTGDGVNDAPSLKQADIGIAMGRKGTEAAREASQMVLMDDNFASIGAAVHEGRAVYDNIRKVISWTVPTNGGEALAVIAAVLFGWALPMTPAQILWINLVLTITLGLSLA
ncbi:MAG TPA: HAD-IC family P-type ATPase, partial [Burkholderiaceae bacterium]|nr:HAD-IC family P-type ATPase [Burkholderiaceae bacterium]